MSEHRYPTCTREDLIRLLGEAHAEVDEATGVIITAVEAAAVGDPDAAVKALARYVLDNGHIREATNATLGRLANLADPAVLEGRPVRFEQVLNTWEKAWSSHADNHVGAPTKSDIAKAADEARRAVTDEPGQCRQLLQDAHRAGANFRADIYEGDL